MRVISAYLLAVLGGVNSPNADNINKILESVGVSADAERVTLLIEEMQGKSLAEVIEAGKEKLSKAPAMGAAPASGGAAAAAGGAAAAGEAAAEEKEEESEEVCGLLVVVVVVLLVIRCSVRVWWWHASHVRVALASLWYSSSSLPCRRWAWACSVTTKTSMYFQCCVVL
jgi:large subunit ribosomal protein LP2